MPDQITPPVAKVLDALRTRIYPDSRGAMLKPTSRGWESRCPAHPDRTPSLGIAVGDDGRCLLKCAAGCNFIQITSALGLEAKDLFMPTTPATNGHAPHAPYTRAPGRPKTRHATLERAIAAAAYGVSQRCHIPQELLMHVAGRDKTTGLRMYHNADGSNCAVVIRHNLPKEPNAAADAKPAKQFSPIFAEGDKWVVGDPPGGWPMYRLPEVLHAIKDRRPIWLTEGEDAADALRECGLIATTTAHGSQSPGLTDLRHLAGADEVIIWPDNDPQSKDATTGQPRFNADGTPHIVGLEYARDVARRLMAIFPLLKVRIITVPNLPPKGDAVDYVDAWPKDVPDGMIAAELEALAAATPPLTAPPPITPPAQPVEVAPAPAPQTYPMTDLGNGERFACQHNGKVLYAGGDWFIWDSRRWRRDDTYYVEQLAKRTIRAIFKEAAEKTDSRERDEMIKWGKASESSRAIGAMLQCARSEPNIARTLALFDTDRFALNCQNGTIDLKTGELRPHNPLDLITKLAPVPYNPNSTAPTFLAYLDRIFAKSALLTTYVQKLLGMATSGDCNSPIFPIFYGKGSNGKSTILDCCKGILGDYASDAPDSLLTEQTRQEHPCELADLQGRRLIIGSETKAGDKLRLQLIKKLTGEVTVKARRMYGDWYEFPRTHHLILMTNDKPRIPEDTEAAWRRIRLVPFTVEIPENERVEGFAEKLLKIDAPGILTWLVQGCILWQKEGLKSPPEVAEATQHYREESDPLREFIDEACLLHSTYQIAKGTIRRAYLNFCQERGTKPVSNHTFNERMKGRGFTDVRTETERQWKGICLNDPNHPTDLYHQKPPTDEGYQGG